MKDKTIKDSYYGNLVPNEKQMMKGSDAATLSAQLTKIENLLLEAGGDETAALLERYEKAQSSLNAITAEVNYIDGFKTGARFLMEILDDTHENMKPITG